MKSENHTFPGVLGYKLSAKLDLPDDQEPVAYVLFGHSFTGSKQLSAVHNIAKELTRLGFALMRFDFTGLGQSEGDFSDTNFSTNVGDILQAVKYLRENFKAPKIMIGHSLGGTAVIAATKEVSEVRAIATIGSPYEPSHLQHIFTDEDKGRLYLEGRTLITIGGREFCIQKHFIEDLKSVDLKSDLAKLGRALVVFHSPQDTIVDLENAKKIFQAARHPKSFISLDKADHLLTKKEDAEYVAKVLSAWASRYVIES